MRHVIGTSLLTVSACIACLLLPAGCESTPEAYKAEADAFVYSELAARWDKQYGLKTNYRLDESERLPHDPNLLQAVLTEDHVLTLPTAAAVATINNRQYQTEKETLYRTALDLRLIQHVFEPNPFAFLAAGYAETERKTSRLDVDQQKIGGFVTDAALDTDTEQVTDRKLAGESDLGFDMLLEGGGRIAARLSAAYLDVLSGDLESGLTSVFRFAVEQPLLRGAGREIAREPLTQAERNVLYQVRSFNRFRKTFVVDVISQYYRVLQLADNLDNAHTNLRNLEQIYGKMDSLVKAGRMPHHELEEAEQEKLDARDAHLKADREYRQALDEFKLTLAVPPEMEFQLDLSELEALRTEPVDELGFQEHEAIATARDVRLDMANAADFVDDAERKVKVALDSTRMELNLAARSLNDVGRRDNPGQFLGILLAEDTYRVGAEMDLPLDRTLEKNEYRAALLDLEEAKRFREETQDQLSLEVRTAYRNLIEAHHRHQVQSEGYALARKRLDNTVQLLQYRRANVRDVLRSQRDFYNARLESTDAVVDYAVAILEFYRDTGLLQVRPDGMWSKQIAAK